MSLIRAIVDSRFGDDDIVGLQPLAHTWPEPRMGDLLRLRLRRLCRDVVGELRWLGLGGFRVTDLVEVQSVQEFAEDELHLHAGKDRVPDLLKT